MLLLLCTRNRLRIGHLELTGSGWRSIVASLHTLNVLYAILFTGVFTIHSGYAPDTDSELGTLTLNSPQDWMEKGYHGNLEQLPEMTSIQKNLIEDFQGNR